MLLQCSEWIMHIVCNMYLNEFCTINQTQYGWIMIYNLLRNTGKTPASTKTTQSDQKRRHNTRTMSTLIKKIWLWKLLINFRNLWKSYENVFLSYLEDLGDPISQSVKTIIPYWGCTELTHDPHAQEEGRSPVTSVKLTQNFETGRWVTEMMVPNDGVSKVKEGNLFP